MHRPGGEILNQRRCAGGAGGRCKQGTPWCVPAGGQTGGCLRAAAALIRGRGSVRTPSLSPHRWGHTQCLHLLLTVICKSALRHCAAGQEDQKRPQDAERPHYDSSPPARRGVQPPLARPIVCWRCLAGKQGWLWQPAAVQTTQKELPPNPSDPSHRRAGARKRIQARYYPEDWREWRNVRRRQRNETEMVPTSCRQMITQDLQVPVEVPLV